MSECDKCGLEDPECHCYLYEIEERVTKLEERLSRLTNELQRVVDLLRNEKDER